MIIITKTCKFVDNTFNETEVCKVVILFQVGSFKNIIALSVLGTLFGYCVG